MGAQLQSAELAAEALRWDVQQATADLAREQQQAQQLQKARGAEGWGGMEERGGEGWAAAILWDGCVFVRSRLPVQGLKVLAVHAAQGCWLATGKYESGRTCAPSLWHLPTAAAGVVQGAAAGLAPFL